MIKDLIKKNRTYRRYYEDFEIKRNVLEELVDLARLSASAANRQPLKYILSKKARNSYLLVLYSTLFGKGFNQVKLYR